MIILDTNVVSEALRPRPEPLVLQWLDDHMASTLFLTTVSLAELRYGVALLPDGRRKEGLAAALDTTILSLFSGRLLSFDEAAAGAYASLMAKARSEGHAIPVADGFIAAIAAAKGFVVASRDQQPFVAAGVPVVNPWAV